MGAILGIILGQNLKYSIIIYIGILIEVFCSPPNLVGVGHFLSSCIRKKSATPVFGYCIRRNLNEKNCRGEYCSSVLRRYTKIIYRYLKIIFNKKILITFIFSVTVFNIYTLILNNKYEDFYKKVGEEVELEGVIISSAKESEHYNSYTIKGKTNEFKNKKFIVYVKKGKVLEYGDIVKITGALSKPDDSRNYKGFNYKKYLQTEKIYGIIMAEYTEVKSKNNTLLIFKLSNNLRNKIIEKIKTFLPQETSGLLIGLMLGEKSNITEEVRLNFQKSSLAHILAVSGAHVSYIILGLNYIVSINRLPKKSGYIFIIIVLIAFIFITNFSVSVIRACIMCIILILSKLFYRKSDILNTISISIIIIIIFNPYSINSVSMQLSYLGTIGVIFIAPIIENKFLKIIKRLPKKIKLNSDEMQRIAKD